MGKPEGRIEVDRGPQEPILRPGVRRWHIMHMAHQTAKRKLGKPKPVMSMEGHVTVLEERSISMDARLNSCFAKTGAVLEYGGTITEQVAEQMAEA